MMMIFNTSAALIGENHCKSGTKVQSRGISDIVMGAKNKQKHAHCAGVGAQHDGINGRVGRPPTFTSSRLSVDGCRWRWDVLACRAGPNYCH